MANFIEKVIEKLINDGLITESELQQRIEEARASSPLAPLPAMQEDIASLVFETMVKDARITELEQVNADLTFMVMMGGI